LSTDNRDSVKRRLQSTTGPERKTLMDGLPYSVGYGKPPEHTRFKPGRSGNPRGRAKGSPNVSTVLNAELSAKMHIVEGGRARKLSKGQVLIRQMVNKAVTGDVKAATFVLGLALKQQLEPEGPRSQDPLFDEKTLEGLRQLKSLLESRQQAERRDPNDDLDD
jgi:hypothetical protein